jgi:C4-dicarboxylate-specific signal transduction histidine kinase
VNPSIPQPENLHVEVDANVVRQLGEELITDAEQALLELIKNAYDADAQVARVIVNTEEVNEEGSDKRRQKGSIVVQDDGSGMNLDSIQRGWLTISLSMKKSLKDRGKRTPVFHRTPLGDKGLGRLGTMKIGDSIEIVTHAAKDQEGYRVRLSWSEFMPGTLLSRVPVEVERVGAARRTGTRLTITGLHEPQYWKGSVRQEHLLESMSQLISPFQRFTNFRIVLEVDGNNLELHEIGDNVRNGATARFSYRWTGDVLECKAQLKMGLFRGSTDGDEEYARLVFGDRGASLAQFLKSEAKIRGNLTTTAKGPWFIEVVQNIDRKDFLQGRGEDPGPFAGEIDAFELDAHESSELFSTASEYRKYIKRFAGVSVYRDHFAIRMEEDWLRLGQAWTSGRSYYGLKPANTIGFFELSAQTNPQLREKSDREGFLDTSASRGFFAITAESVEFANSVLTDVRRAFVRFKERQLTTEARLPSAWTPSDAVKALTEARQAAKSAQATLASTERQRKAAVVKVKDSLQLLVEHGALPPAQLKAAKQVIGQLDEVVGEWEIQRSLLEEQLSALREDQALTGALLERFDQFKRQLDEVYEAVGLGLVAEGVAHEMEGVLEDLIQRTNRASSRAKKLGDANLVGYVEAVRATISSLRKQVSFLDPMLRSAREQKGIFSMAQLVGEFVDLRRERLSRFDITPTIVNERDFTVRISRGRVIQVLENLVRNSEYWLRQNASSIKRQIIFEISAPRVVVSDSGPGVKPAMEKALFEPFVSGKPAGEGRGLGLFISRQLLQRDGCDLVLEPDRNARGRRYKFAVDFQTVEVKKSELISSTVL